MLKLISMRNRWLSLILLVLSGCRGQNQSLLDDLSALKKEFIAEVLQGSVEECPFDLSYHFRTVFYSKQLVSLFGEFHSYTHLPHGWTKYEGRTFYKNNGKFVPLLLSHLISTKESWEFIRKYCETLLKSDPCTYFSGQEPLRTTLALEDLNTFTLDDQALILVFQPYTVAGGTDGPPIVRIPWEELRGVISPSHPLCVILNETIHSKCFIASWDENSLERSLKEYDRSQEHLKN